MRPASRTAGRWRPSSTTSSASCSTSCRRPGVTRRLEVDYLKPVLTGVPYVVRGRVDRRDGRKLWVSCECTDPDGVVDLPRRPGCSSWSTLSHFAVATSGGGQDPVAP